MNLRATLIGDGKSFEHRQFVRISQHVERVDESLVNGQRFFFMIRFPEQVGALQRRVKEVDDRVDLSAFDRGIKRLTRFA